MSATQGFQQHTSPYPSHTGSFGGSGSGSSGSSGFTGYPRQAPPVQVRSVEIETTQKMTGSQRRENTADAELEDLLRSQRARIKVIGCGGGGNNTINRIAEVGVKGATTVAVNTDAQDLLYTTADVKILIGKETTKGMGAGSIPKIGEEAARENESEIREVLKDTDMVFITCGLGGGTGTGSAPVIAEIAKKSWYY